tara:strand:+ start:5825 stop:7363 length:1539 start_codon:yes stop_codon:yes gene_type:complete
MATLELKKFGGVRYNARREITEQLRLRQSFERKLSLNLITEFAKIGDIARREYLERSSIELTGNLIEGRILKILEPHYRSVIEAFGLRMLRHQKQDSQFELLIRDYMRVSGLGAVKKISDTTRKDLVKVMLEADKEALGTRYVADQIFQSTRGNYSRARSATISRTETHNAASYANHSVAKEMNIPNLQKQWVSVTDDRTRSKHAAMNGTIIPMDEDFEVPTNFGTALMDRPGDSRGGAANVVNCRCVLLYVQPEDTVIDDAQPKPQKITPPPPPPKNLVLTDVITMLPNSKFKKSDIEDRINRNMTPLTLAVSNKLEKPDVILEGKGEYFPLSREIVTNTDELTPIHEYGHHVDHMMGQKVNRMFVSFSIGGTDFMSALDLDAKNMGLGKGMRKKKAIDRYLDELYDKKEGTRTYSYGRQEIIDYYVPKYLEAENLSDIIDGMTKGKFAKENAGVYGHSASYWKREDNLYVETFAEIFTVYKSRKAKRWLKDNMPNTLKAFDELLKGVIDD